MVMDDLTLKGVIDPSSIWTVICMLASGCKTSGRVFLGNQKAKNKAQDFRI